MLRSQPKPLNARHQDCRLRSQAMRPLKTYSLRSLSLLLGLSLSLTLSSCTSGPSGLESKVDAPQPEATTSDREGYQVVEAYQVAAESQTNPDPKALALAVFGYTEPGEGNFQETVELLSESTDKAVVMLTQTNLPDDSVRSMRYRIEMVPVPGATDQWQIAWVGRQSQCWPDRGHQDWSAQTCR